MKKLFVTVLLLSASANADYFFCKINVDGKVSAQEADYRIFETSVAQSGFRCSGILVAGGMVNVAITADGFPGWQVKSEGKLGAKVETYTRDPNTNVGTEITCECGLQ